MSQQQMFPEEEKSEVKKQFPTLEDLMFRNKDAINRDKKKKNRKWKK